MINSNQVRRIKIPCFKWKIIDDAVDFNPQDTYFEIGITESGHCIFYFGDGFETDVKDLYEMLRFLDDKKELYEEIATLKKAIADIKSFLVI